MELLADERKILLAMIQIEDEGHGWYVSDPDLRQRLYDKGLERYDRPTDLAREILNKPKPPPSAEEIATLRTWIDHGQCSGFRLDALNRRGLVDPFGELTEAGAAALGRKL